MQFFSVSEEVLFVLYICLVFFALIQIGYYLSFFIGFKKNHFSDEKKCSIPTSVVICTKNDIEQLKSNLPKILSQDYPDFEVIVVNDGSWDGTKNFLDRIALEVDRLRLIHLDKDRNHTAGKKFALTMGIKAAKNEHLLLIDSDCYPHSNSWISLMMCKFKDGKEVVLGFSPYKKHMGLLNLFIRYETLFVGMQYVSYALNGKPYMGVGRNLAYKKSLFLGQKGFAKHINLAAGDDDLFVQSIANKKNTAVCIQPDSFTISQPHRKVGDWWKQKKRHLSIGTAYKGGIKFALGTFNLSFILFYMLGILLFVLGFSWQLIALAYLIRTIILWVFTIYSFGKLKDVLLGVLFPILEILYFFYYIIIGPSSFFKDKNKW